MPFFKPIFKKISELWYPQAVSIGKPVEMDELCDEIALISSLSKADSKAAMQAMGLVLGKFMSSGRTVHVDGLGTFYYTCIAEGTGVESAEKVSAKQITGTRVRFIPESKRNGKTITRALVDENVKWVNVNSISKLDGTGTSEQPGGGEGEEGGGESPDPIV